MRAWIWLFLPLGLMSVSAHAEHHFTFQTPYDKFELVLTGSHGTVDGKPADLKSFAEVLPMLTKPLTAECDSVPKTKAPITVTEGDKTRSIYVKQGLVTDGKNCLTVQGDGLYYFPAHRDFFIGTKTDSIQLKSPLKIFRQGNKLLALKKKGKQWVNENPEQLLNWDFLERLENSLNDFKIRLRVNEAIAEGKPKMIIQSGPQNYEFYKVTDVLWALKKPGTKWLEASDDWSFWYDFDQGVIEDRYSEQIKTAGDQTKPKEERMAALAKLDVTWSPNLRELYHKLLLHDNEDASLQEIALKQLKRKPSIETAGVMVQFIEKSKDDELKKEAGIVLKLQNPKGPKYNPAASDEEKAKTLEFWRNWWKQNSKES
jgi:hypothetical protein